MRRTKRGGWPYSQPPNVPFTINHDSPQARGLLLWMPWGGGTPGAHRHVDRIRGLVFTEGGTPVWVADGERGWSMLFEDGSSEYLEVDQAVVTGPPFTLSCWARADRDDEELSPIWLGDKDVAARYYGIRLEGDVANDPVYFVAIGDADAEIAATSTGFIINTWHHVCAVCAADDDRAVYINGGSKGTAISNIGNVAVDRTSIGRMGDSSPGYYMDGRIADVRIYNRALTDAEVWQFYTEPWELYRPLIQRARASSPTVRIPRYGFTNFQVPGIV